MRSHGIRFLGRILQSNASAAGGTNAMRAALVAVAVLQKNRIVCSHGHRRHLDPATHDETYLLKRKHV
jgi:hypothetical protein